MSYQTICQLLLLLLLNLTCCVWLNGPSACCDHVSWWGKPQLSTHTGHCSHLTPHTPQALSGLVHSVGKPKLNPEHHSEHNAHERWLSHCLSHWSGFCLVTFFHSNSSRQLNPLHQIRALLSISPPLPPFLFLSLNNGQSHINTNGSFHCVYSQRWPHYPWVFCLFVPRLKKLNWAAGRGGLQGEEDQKGEEGGWRCGFREGTGSRRHRGSLWLWRGQISDRRVGGQGMLVTMTDGDDNKNDSNDDDIEVIR